MKSKLLTFLSIATIIVGMYLVIQPMYINHNYDTKIEKQKKEYSPVKAKESLTDVEQELIKTQDIDGNKALPTQYDEDTRGLVVGKIGIPSIDVSLPIYKGETSYLGDNMEYGAVTNKVNQEMGLRNYVLSSHIINNKKQLFSSLSETKVGDKVYLEDTEYIYTYVITEEKSVKPSEVWILDDIDGKATITLYTCLYINEYENGIQKTDRTVRFGDYVGKQKITKELDEKYFNF